MAYLSQVVYINEEDYSTLFSEGEITKGGETYEYDESALYIIKDVSVPEYATRSGYAATAGTSTMAVNDGSGNNIVQTYSKKPLVIEVNEDDLPKNLPDGTYDSVTQALSDNREVIVKVTRDVADDEIVYCRFSADWSDQESNYYFYNSSVGLGICLGGNNLIYSEGQYSPNYHSHGNINQNGQLSTTVTIANHDKLVITDADNSSRIKASSISFDGSTTTKALSQKGTWETFYQKPSGGIPATDLTSAVQTLLTAAGTALQPADITTLTNKVTALEDLVATDSDAVIDKFNEIVAFLNGIGATDTLQGLLADIATQINAKYTKPSGGIPKTDLASAVQTSLGLADTAVQPSFLNSSLYAGSINTSTTRSYITEPEFKSVKINGSSTNSASSNNCVLQYDTTNKCLNFIFN